MVVNPGELSVIDPANLKYRSICTSLPPLRNSHNILDSWLSWSRDENGIHHVVSTGEMGMISRPLCGLVDHTIGNGMWMSEVENPKVCQACLSGIESGKIRQ